MKIYRVLTAGVNHSFYIFEGFVQICHWVFVLQYQGGEERGQGELLTVDGK